MAARRAARGVALVQRSAADVAAEPVAGRFTDTALVLPVLPVTSMLGTAEDGSASGAGAGATTTTVGAAPVPDDRTSALVAATSPRLGRGDADTSLRTNAIARTASVVAAKVATAKAPISVVRGPHCGHHCAVSRQAGLKPFLRQAQALPKAFALRTVEIPWW